MPVYVYRRGDGSSFEFAQRITADALVCCPTTGQGVVRVMQPFSAHYKGTGFYTTDHRKAHGRRRRPRTGVVWFSRPLTFRRNLPRRATVSIRASTDALVPGRGAATS